MNAPAFIATPNGVERILVSSRFADELVPMLNTFRSLETIFKPVVVALSAVKF